MHQYEVHVYLRHQYVITDSGVRHPSSMRAVHHIVRHHEHVQGKQIEKHVILLKVVCQYEIIVWEHYLLVSLMDSGIVHQRMIQLVQYIVRKNEHVFRWKTD